MAYYTRDGHKRLKNSLEELRIDFEKKLRELGAVEKENNLAESTEFIQTRFNVSYTYNNERAKIIENLNNAIIIEDTDEYRNWDGKTVSRKCIITIDYNGYKETYKILGYNDADPDNNILSNEAPIVKALLGHKVGDFVDFYGSTIYIENIKRIESELTKSQEIVETKVLRP